ncbi:MAG: chromate efflux transporter [Elusimicrobia bacterium]|nr:chromate efflux transporter [Elusimicrobiota bacterium]
MGPKTELKQILLYMLKLGATGFGGPIALVNYMEKELVERKKIVAPEEFKLGLALAQAAPGPLAGQMSIWLGYIKGGAWGALLSGIAFVLPAFFIVLILSVFYVDYQGLPWVKKIFQGINPAVLAIMMIASVRLSRRVLGVKKLLWAIFMCLAALTAVTRAEIAYAFLAAGLLGLFVYAPPKKQFPGSACLGSFFLGPLTWGAPAAQTLGSTFLFFVKTGAFVFGTGMAIVPFLYKGVVQDYRWLNDAQFLDAVAVSMITPGPLLITVAFIGYLAAGLAGAVLATIGIFTPVYFFTVIPAPYFKRYKDQPQLKAFVDGITAAAVGALAGAVVLLIPQAVPNLKCAVIFLASLILLLGSKFPDAVIVLAAGLAGLLLP